MVHRRIFALTITVALVAFQAGCLNEGCDLVARTLFTIDITSASGQTPVVESLYISNLFQTYKCAPPTERPDGMHVLCHGPNETSGGAGEYSYEVKTDTGSYTGVVNVRAGECHAISQTVYLVVE